MELKINVGNATCSRLLISELRALVFLIAPMLMRVMMLAAPIAAPTSIRRLLVNDVVCETRE